MSSRSIHCNISSLLVDPVDFSGGTFLVSFNAGDNRVCLDIEIQDDSLSEPPEDFQVTLSTNDPAVVAVDPSRAVVEIIDNDGMFMYIENPKDCTSKLAVTWLIIQIIFYHNTPMWPCNREVAWQVNPMTGFHCSENFCGLLFSFHFSLRCFRGSDWV